MYTVLCMLTTCLTNAMLTEDCQDSDKLVLPYQLLSCKLWLHLRLLPLLNICTIAGLSPGAVFVFSDFYELFLVKASENFM